MNCPKCRGTNVVWQEYVCHSRPISRKPTSETYFYVHGSDEKIEYEVCKEESFYCEDCLETFPIPEEVTLEHV